MRERIATAALCAYPSTVRAMVGAEMLGTLLDASAASRMRFMREIVDLVRIGLRARAMQTANVGARRLVADGFCRGAILVMTLDLSTLLAQKFERGYSDSLLTSWSIATLLVVLALALVGYERLAGVGALTWTALRIPDLIHHQPPIGSNAFTSLAPTIVPVLCFTVLLLAPRRRAVDPRRLAWLAATAVLVMGLGPPGGAGLLGALVVIGASLLVVVASALLPTDPRLAIACALPASYVGVMVVGQSTVPPLLLAAAPLAILLAVTRNRQLQRRAARGCS